jgi:hypothetical protein
MSRIIEFVVDQRIAVYKLNLTAVILQAEIGEKELATARCKCTASNDTMFHNYQRCLALLVT